MKTIPLFKVYSEVVTANLILPRKEKYTVKDLNNVLTDSLFANRTLSFWEAVFIVKCSATYHNTDWSDGFSRAIKKQEQKELSIF